MKKLLSLLLALTLVASLVVPAIAVEPEVALPTATVTEIPEEDRNPEVPLTFALKFIADEPEEPQLEAYGKWYADFFLKISGVEEGPKFAADVEGADGYLAGEYGSWGWIPVPFDAGLVEVPADTEIPVMDIAAKLMGQGGLRINYSEVYDMVGEFNCGIYFNPEYLAAHPDLKVTLALRLVNPDDFNKAYEENEALPPEKWQVILDYSKMECYTIGEIYEFSAVAAIENDKFFSLSEAIAAAETGDTITMIGDEYVVESAGITVDKKVTIDLNGFDVDFAGDGFVVEANGDLTVKGEGNVTAANTVGNYVAVWAKGGQTTIQGGNWAMANKDGNGEGNSLIYSKGGNITVEGGYFNSENTDNNYGGKPWNFVLNRNNSYNGVIVVTGGTFEDYDPALSDDVLAEPPYLADGYESIGNADGEFTVYKHDVKPVAEDPATCTEDGVKAYYTCEACGKLYSDAEGKTEVEAKDLVIPAAHKLDEVPAQAASCLGTGINKHYKCSACGKLFKDAEGKTAMEEKDTIVPAAGHKMTKTAAKAATCTEAGNIEYYTCSVCKKTFADEAGEKELKAEELVVKAKGHDKAVEIPAVAATCTEAGKTAGAKCSVCGEVSLAQEIVPAAGHKMTKTAAKAATYTEEGNMEYYTCSVCGKLFADEKGEKAITAADTVIAKLPAVEIEIPVIPEKPETPETPETPDQPETEKPEEPEVEVLPEIKVEKVEVKEEAADEVIEKAVEEAKAEEKAPVVVIDVKKEVVEAVQKQDETVKEEQIKVATVTIPKATVEKVAKVDEEATLAVNLTTATVIMDNKALETVAEKAEGKSVELKIEHVEVETLKEEQQAAVEDKNVALTITAELICSETKKEIAKEEAGGFGGGKVTVAVAVPAKLPEGVKAADLKVYYVADDGTVTEVKSEVKDGKIVFELKHFSEYVIAAEKPASPATGDSMNIALYGALAIMSVLGMAVVLKKKAF